MQFSPELRPSVASGRITLSFRLWQRPQVKVGGQYATAGVRIEIDSIEMVPFSSVTPADVRRSGETDRRFVRRERGIAVDQVGEIHGSDRAASHLPLQGGEPAPDLIRGRREAPGGGRRR